jgi:hypothetical protein
MFTERDFIKLAAAGRHLFVQKVYFGVLTIQYVNLHEVLFEVSLLFQEQ